MDNKKYLLFTYGTLKKGHGNHSVLSRHKPKFLGTFKTKPLYQLFNVGYFPALIVNEKDGVSVEGELYEIDEDCKRSCDRLEGKPFLYDDKTIQLDSDEYPECITYIYQREVKQLENIGTVWN